MVATQGDSVSPEALNVFFKGAILAENGSKVITQDQFSAIKREHEIRLLSDDYEITNMEGEPLSTFELTFNPKTAEMQRKESVQSSDSAQARQQKEKEGALNLANFSIEALMEETDEPELQVQDLMQIFVDYDDFKDFKKRDWSKFFGLFSTKLAQINQKLNRAEEDRDLFMREAQVAELRLMDNFKDVEEESQ